ncbi:glycosyltransferase [Paracoccus liaowanqingii]|uniref:Glycosyltransferase n=1 Tax=Paracoccus liaowanqingii TaxID=2560053 RepID=A0A4Z1C1A7_9RHOB|nr:glycosyltransferase [Paracoccus liaowanqingii]TGN55589.1 glycosyltransferase [Paracoccus liaowanqingii]
MAQLAYLPRPANLPDRADPAAGRQGAVVLRGPAPGTRDPRPLGQILLEDGAITPNDLLKATVVTQRHGLRLGQVLLAQGAVAPDALTRALSRQWRTSCIDPTESRADPRLIDVAGAGFCLTHGLLPWRRIGGVTWIATARPDEFAACLPLLPPEFGHVRMLLCNEDQAQAAVLTSRGTRLIREAETRVPALESCRTQNHARTGRLAAGLLALALVGVVAAPAVLVALLAGWAVLTLLTQSGLKLLSFLAARRVRIEVEGIARAQAEAGQPPVPDAALPVISVMVPLFEESDVTGKLVARLARLAYPRELTDILLVIEASDQVTEKALEGARLPAWIRVIRVPDGPIKTKPRALNYALNFCRGQIVGIWDAEDRPDADQLHKVAHRFRTAPPEVACLQGALDFYNPRTNWLARCFTVEYASWFRVLLPGVARLGLVVPLGGTTLFFRRPLLEQVGAWDAWNVTEDADLGARLARRGYRTEIIDTTTDEEANCRGLPWVKQRSRWLKGYAMTWGVHMRDPAALYRDLGALRFWGFQVQFLGALSQYLMAPVLWSFWLLAFGLPHPLRAPLESSLGNWAVMGLFSLFIGSEALAIFVGMRAVRGSKHRHLLPWVPKLHFYHPLGCLAGWKAIYEVVTKPFYWDKTAHGLFVEAADQPGALPLAPGLVSLPVLGQIGGRSLSEVAAELQETAQHASDADEISHGAGFSKGHGSSDGPAPRDVASVDGAANDREEAAEHRQSGDRHQSMAQR